MSAEDHVSTPANPTVYAMRPQPELNITLHDKCFDDMVTIVAVERACELPVLRYSVECTELSRETMLRRLKELHETISRLPDDGTLGDVAKALNTDLDDLNNWA